MSPLRPILAALVFLALAWGKSYSLEQVEQDVYLLPNGLVRVVDVRTWRFDGVFREVFLEIDPRRGGQVRFEEARALDGGPPIRYEVEGNRISLTAGPPDRSGNLPVLAENQRRTFRISYTLSNEVAVAQDAALFDRQVLEPEHAAVGAYLLRLHAPKPVSPCRDCSGCLSLPEGGASGRSSSTQPSRLPPCGWPRSARTSLCGPGSSSRPGPLTFAP